MVVGRGESVGLMHHSLQYHRRIGQRVHDRISHPRGDDSIKQGRRKFFKLQSTVCRLNKVILAKRGRIGGYIFLAGWKNGNS